MGYNNAPHKIHRILNVGTVYRLNKRLREGKLKELILFSEALHDKKIAEIAQKITVEAAFLGEFLFQCSQQCVINILFMGTFSHLNLLSRVLVSKHRT